LATALDASLFVDQNDVADRVVAAVRQDYNVAVFGARGAGKSSLLHYAEYRLRDERRMVSIDASVAADAASFLQLVRFRLGLAPSPAETVRSSVSAIFQPQRPRAEFGELLWVLEDLRADSEQDDDPRPLTLVVDDLDPKIAHTVFGRLRNEMWGLGYRWLVGAAEDARTTFLTPPADSFFEVVVSIEPMPIALLTSLLVRRAEGELPEAVAAELAELAEGSPRRALTLARNALLNGGEMGEMVAAHADVAARLEPLSAGARMLYGELETRGQASASDSELLNRFGWSRQRARRAFGELEEAGLVVAQDEARQTPGRPRRIYAPVLGQGSQ
jgi:hypothetical protein